MIRMVTIRDYVAARETRRIYGRRRDSGLGLLAAVVVTVFAALALL